VIEIDRLGDVVEGHELRGRIARLLAVSAVMTITAASEYPSRRRWSMGRPSIRGRRMSRSTKSVSIPGGDQVEWGGQFDNLERARYRLGLVLPMTMVMIFALLFIAFGSAAEAGLVLMYVLFSLVGGILMLWLRGINLSVSAAVGFISLFGVAVMSGVLLIAEIGRQRRELGLPL
jgi:heavy metal efflux system protein